MSPRLIFLGVLFGVLFLSFRVPAATTHILDSSEHHLGTAGHPEWQWFENKTPESDTLLLKFNSKANEHEGTLFIRQEDVKTDWRVKVNDRALGTLALMDVPMVSTLAVPPGTLRDGENTITISPSATGDDIILREISFVEAPVAEAVNEASLEITVIDSDSQDPLPCRITIVDEKKNLPPIYAYPGQNLAVRAGVIYSGNGRAKVGLREGNYTVFANRGPEYGMDSRTFNLTRSQPTKLRLRINREVSTPGWAACDTHIHTFTHSRHGDATAEERTLTLAGEGIELPVTTEHNLVIDPSNVVRRMQVDKYFTPIIGDEVTTEAGHFNVFPILPGSPPPDHRTRDWTKLMQNLRSTPGVQVVVLNHPRNIHTNFQPFNRTNYNAITGENKRGPEFSFDAIEVVNSAALQSDWMLTYRDWFALLNYGYRITAVGSSDSHEVNRFIVGQGRSYVACHDSDPGNINVSEVYDSFKKGRVLVSMGLFTQMSVNDKFQVGDTVNDNARDLKIEVSVQSPEWAQPDLVELFANGTKIREHRFRNSPSQVKSQMMSQPRKVVWKLPRPDYDVHLVAIASGAGQTIPFWPISRPYQPTSRIWHPPVIGSTNPIWVDGDRDGKITSCRAYASNVVGKFKTEPKRLLRELEKYDESISSQAASLCHSSGIDIQTQEFARALAHSSAPVRKGFQNYLGTISPTN